jgi:hypothetical protein
VRAAAAAGCTVAQLVDLVKDSGALSEPPDTHDGITFTLTLKDLGRRLWHELQAVAVPDRTEWFQALLEPQKIGLVVTLVEQGFRPEIIARELGVPSLQVREWHNTYADRIGAQVTQIRLTTLAGHVQMAAERAQEGLQLKGDWKGYFSITEKMVGILQSLGVVDKAIQRVEVTHRHEDNKSEDIDALIELEKKERRRLEELKVANDEKLDQVPELSFDKEQ